MDLKSYWVFTRLKFGGKDEVFQYIWETYYRKISYYLQLKFSLQDDVEDIMQDVMIKIYKGLEKYSIRYSLSTYLYTIARNCCISYLKKRQRRDNLTTDLDVQELPGHGQQPVEEDLLTSNLMETIDRLLSGFDEQRREIIYLRLYEKLSYKEIARIVNITPGLVKSRLYSIKQKLQIELKDYL